MAGFERKQKTIGGSMFSIVPLDFKRGKEGLMKLLGVIAPAIGAALSGGRGVMAVLGQPNLAAMLGDALGQLPAKLDPATLEWFETAFGEKTMAEVGTPSITMKLDSEGARSMAFESLGYMAFFEWLAFCLEVNYGGFFGAALPLAKKPALTTATP